MADDLSIADDSAGAAREPETESEILRATLSARPSCTALPAFPASVALARRHVRDTLSAWGRPDLADTVELIASELVTNAIAATQNLYTGPAGGPGGGPPGEVWLGMAYVKDFVLLEVGDASEKRPEPRQADPEDLGGRGLWLVGELATCWGCRPRRAGGKIVWAAVDAILTQ